MREADQQTPRPAFLAAASHNLGNTAKSVIWMHEYIHIPGYVAILRQYHLYWDIEFPKPIEGQPDPANQFVFAECAETNRTLRESVIDLSGHARE